MYLRTKLEVGFGANQVTEGNQDLSNRYGTYNKPSLQKFLSVLKLDIAYKKANGNYLYYQKGQEEIAVLDLLGGFGSTLIGHSHIEVKEYACELLRQDIPIHAQGSIREHAVALSEHLNDLIRAEFEFSSRSHYLSTFVNTGTEANEAALKHALIEWQSRRDKVWAQLEMKRSALLQFLTHDSPELARINDEIELLSQMIPHVVALEGAFHGKTAGSISATHKSDYSKMYSGRPIATLFLPKSLSKAEIELFFNQHRKCFGEGVFFSPIIAVFIELIQGEGGVHCLEQDFVTHLANATSQNEIPLVVDEIQTGVFRTGTFLASTQYKITPDYITLGKSLGGGVAKIAALLVKSDRYQDEFGLIHTSTFAEDDFSCAISLRALQILGRIDHLKGRAQEFESRIKSAFRELSLEFPSIIREVRGRGWLLGVEINTDYDGCAPVLVSVFNQTGFMTLLFASYLLHHHGIRVAASLSQNNTIRIEPSAFLKEDEIQQTIYAFRDLVRHVYENKWAHLTSHLWQCTSHFKNSEIISTKRPKPIFSSKSTPKVVFLSHVINLSHFRRLDPLAKNLEESDAIKIMKDFHHTGKSTVLHQQEIFAMNGNKVLFELRGIPASTEFFEQSLRNGNLDAFYKVREAVLASQDSNADYLGLGQYTSIVSQNGTLLTGHFNPVSIRLTTGNSLTVGLAYRELLQILKDRNLELEDLTVGIVGVAGNICNVYAQMVGDRAKKLTLIHREPYEQSPKFQRATKVILENSKITLDRISFADSLSALIDCDIVILGTNSTKEILFPQHLKASAIVLDISVPSNIHPSVYQNRPDIECFQGGFAKLPLEQKVLSSFIPCPNGEIFACMAETILTGLARLPGHFSLGNIFKSQVVRSLDLADELGIELGSVKKIRVF